ncbi:MAG: GFA family protein [Acidobacteriota bacterium]|nr:GFA family protein [Acidobacteriota bacterium]
MATSSVQGCCLCGELRWEIDLPLDWATHCHCSICRRSHGSVFATYVVGPADSFRWVAGEAQTGSYESSPGFHRHFCSTCGSVSPDRMGEVAFMAAGCLDADPQLRPDRHIFVDSRASWYEIPEDDLARHGAYAQPIAEAQRSPTPELPELSRPGLLRGGCLCGAVAYEVGPGVGIVHCHCSRCRKSRSAAHASNVMCRAQGFVYARGADLVTTYKVPEAEMFTTAFCAVCGGGLPRDPGTAPFAVVPGGSLDTDPGTLPQVHIFVGSKAPWFEIRDAVSQNETYVPGFANSHEWAAAQGG